MNPQHDKIWPYLHGELSNEERVEFERALETDELLRRALAERKTTDTLLHEAATGDNHEELIDTLLEKWEADHPEYQEKPTYSRGKILKLGLPLATAAAAAFVLFSAPWHHGTIHWLRTAYGAGPNVRGESGPKPRYSRADLKRMEKMIRHTIEAEISRRNTPMEKWNLQLHLQEVNGGILLVQIIGHPENRPANSKTWEADFQSLEKLYEQSPAFAETIAIDLAEPGTP